MLRYIVRWLIDGMALTSLAYYVVAIIAARRFFAQCPDVGSDFAPPVSLLKPVRGVDPQAFKNFASFCEQDYPAYEVLFATGDASDPAIPVVQRLIEAFPHCSIRLLIGSGYSKSNDKVSNLCRLAAAAQHEILIVTDSDILVGRDYLRNVVRPFRDQRVGAATCLYSADPENTMGSELEGIGLSTDFCAGVIVAWLLGTIDFTLGATMAVTRKSLEAIGGFQSISDYHADDFELGKRIRSKGWRVELLRYKVVTALASQTLRECVERRLRWAVGIHNSSRAGHIGLIFTQGLAWCLAAAVMQQSLRYAAVFIAGHLILRSAMAWTVAIWGMQDPVVKRRWWLIPVWDALAFATWIASFVRKKIQWRGAEFYIREGRLVPVPGANHDSSFSRVNEYGPN
jgi:ceramide glucosyltransferase